MPRQRKPQSGVARAAGRVANTTTSLGWRDIANTNPTVYRIPTWWSGRVECPAPLSEVGWEYPISVRREGNVFYVSLPKENLKSEIESMETLDLSNVTVTLNTVDWPITVTGNITTDGTFIWTALQVDDVTATNWNITNVTATDVTSASVSATSLTSETSSLWTATADSVDTTTLSVSWTSTLSWNVTAESDLSVTWAISAAEWTITTLTSTSADVWELSVTDWASITNWLTADATTTGTLTVNETSTFTWAMTAGDITSSGATSLNTLSVSWATSLNTLTTSGDATFGGNATIAGSSSITWNQTITGNVTVVWDGTFSNDVTVTRNLNVSWDTTLTDDLFVNGTAHLKDLETTESVDIAWTLRVEGAINGRNGLVVKWQVESDSLVTTNAVVDNITINGNIALWNDATAPDFILQSEKGEPNGVCPLNSYWVVDEQYLPAIYTTAIVKLWVGSFSNSNTSTVIDSDITADSYVHISNYSEIVWDLDENIIPGNWTTPGQITVVSNQVENGSYKYIVVNPLTNCPVVQP